MAQLSFSTIEVTSAMQLFILLVLPCRLSYDVLSAWERNNLQTYEKKFTEKHGHRKDRVYQTNQNANKFYTAPWPVASHF